MEANTFVRMGLTFAFVALLFVGFTAVVFCAALAVLAKSATQRLSGVVGLGVGAGLMLAAVPIGWAREMLLHLVGLRNDFRRPDVDQPDR